MLPPQLVANVRPGRTETDEHDARVVDDRSRTLYQRRDGASRHDEHHDRDRHVDPERPAPGQVVGEEATKERSDHRGDAEDGAKCSLVAAAVPKRDDLSDQRGGRHHDRAAANALQCARCDQHRHRLAQPAQHRTDEEECDRRLEDGLAAEQVPELADDRRDDGRGQQIACDDPGLVAGPAEVGDDGRKCGGHDGLVQGSQQHAEQHRNEDEVASLRAYSGAARFRVRDCGRGCLTRHTCLSSETDRPQAISLGRLEKLRRPCRTQDYT